MRIHSDTLTNRDLIDAASIARVEFGRWEDKGSRKRDHAFDVTLTGESRRRPNDRGQSASADLYAATWDQWGVFLGVLFDRDPEMITPYYLTHDRNGVEMFANGREAFNYRTNARFTKIGGGWDDFWPADAHGDHVFRFEGTAREQSCAKCSAVVRWM